MIHSNELRPNLSISTEQQYQWAQLYIEQLDIPIGLQNI